MVWNKKDFIVNFMGFNVEVYCFASTAQPQNELYVQN